MNAATNERIVIDRLFTDASVDDVWELWTTKEGMESWWGPDGFAVKVTTLDVRAGGGIAYAMTAVDPGQVDFMKKAGLPLTTETRGHFTEVDPPRKLAFIQRIDFIPGVDPYDISHMLLLNAVDGGVRLTLTIDRMHDAHWTEMATRGWNSQLDRLAKLLAER